MREGAGADGSDRVTLTWPDGAIHNAWLRVTVKATPNTGLAQDDVFSFGNLIGETGNGLPGATTLRVNARDVVAVRRSVSSSSSAPVASPFDFNRDGRVNALDVAAARSNLSRSLSLPLIGAAAAPTPPDFAATSLLRTT